MATKLSAVSQKTGTNADDLVYIASTSDAGSTYESKAIKIENLFSSVASGTDLGTFTGSTLSDNASVKTALKNLKLLWRPRLLIALLLSRLLSTTWWTLPPARLTP